MNEEVEIGAESTSLNLNQEESHLGLIGLKKGLFAHSELLITTFREFFNIKFKAKIDITFVLTKTVKSLSCSNI